MVKRSGWPNVTLLVYVCPREDNNLDLPALSQHFNHYTFLAFYKKQWHFLIIKNMTWTTVLRKAKNLCWRKSIKESFWKVQRWRLNIEKKPFCFRGEMPPPTLPAFWDAAPADSCGAQRGAHPAVGMVNTLKALPSAFLYFKFNYFCFNCLLWESNIYIWFYVLKVYHP